LAASIKGYDPLFSIEIKSKRTRNSRTFRNLDGSLTTIFYSLDGKPIRKNATYYSIAGYDGGVSSTGQYSPDQDGTATVRTTSTPYWRAFYSFNTANIPDDAVIISAYIRVYVDQVWDTGTGTLDYCLYGTLDNSDYDRVAEASGICPAFNLYPYGWRQSGNFTNINKTGYSQYRIRGTSVNVNLRDANGTTPAELHVTYVAKPTNVTATRINDSQINVSWTDNSSGEDGHKVERKANGETSWTVKATVPAGTNSWSDTSTSANHRYKYRVRAYKGTTYSQYSSETPFVYTTPSAPSGCTASYVATDNAKCTWTDNSAYEDGFRIEVSINGGSWTFWKNVGANVTDSGNYSVGANKKIAFRVRSYKGSLYSSFSTSGTVYTTPTAPSGVSLSWISRKSFLDG